MAVNQPQTPGVDFTPFPTSCSCADLIANATGLRDPYVNASTRKVVQVILLNQIIAGLNNATEYTDAQLLDLGKCCTCNFTSLDYDAMWTYILWALATEVGTTQSTVSDLIAEACRFNCDPRLIDGMLINLKCKLGQAIVTLDA